MPGEIFNRGYAPPENETEQQMAEIWSEVLEIEKSLIGIEEIARSYIRKIKTIQSGGPYLLAGWSIGGTIAFEMVRQLEQKNENIDFLVLFDVLPPDEDLNIPACPLLCFKRFGKKGPGDGELNEPFMIAILNDIVFVADPVIRRLVKFDTEGQFIGNIKYSGDTGIPAELDSVGKDKFICFLGKYKAENYLFDLTLIDADFKQVKVLLPYSIPRKSLMSNLLNRYSAYTVSRDQIFISMGTAEEYKINVFDFSGKLLYVIEKDYNKIPFDNYEVETKEIPACPLLLSLMGGSLISNFFLPSSTFNLKDYT